MLLTILFDFFIEILDLRCYQYQIRIVDQDIQFIGMDDTIEIWSPRNLEHTLKTDEDFGKEFEQIMNANDAI